MTRSSGGGLPPYLLPTDIRLKKPSPGTRAVDGLDSKIACLVTVNRRNCIADHLADVPHWRIIATIRRNVNDC